MQSRIPLKSLREIMFQGLKASNLSSVKWSVLAHLKSQPRGQNFQAQKPLERSSPHQTRINKNAKNTFKIN